MKGYSIGLGTSTQQPSIASRRVESVSFDGTRVLWSDCGTNGCNVRHRTGASTTTLGLFVYTPLTVQGDANAMFWNAGSYGIRKYTH